MLPYILSPCRPARERHMPGTTGLLNWFKRAMSYFPLLRDWGSMYERRKIFVSLMSRALLSIVHRLLNWILWLKWHTNSIRNPTKWATFYRHGFAMPGRKHQGSRARCMFHMPRAIVLPSLWLRSLGCRASLVPSIPSNTCSGKMTNI